MARVATVSAVAAASTSSAILVRMRTLSFTFCASKSKNPANAATRPAAAPAAATPSNASLLIPFFFSAGATVDASAGPPTIGAPASLFASVDCAAPNASGAIAD